MANSKKAKGNAFEREIATFLTNTLNIGTFIRTQGSGAYFGGKNQIRSKAHTSRTIELLRGDIIPPEGCHLVVECKSHKTLIGGFHSVIDSTSSHIQKWLNEVRADSSNGTEPHMLAFKITNTRKIFFVIPRELFAPNPCTPFVKYIHEGDHLYFIVEHQVFANDGRIKDHFIKKITEAHNE